jgi:hypothetical protein
VRAPLARRLLAEYLSPAFLAAVVIGSGIAASELSPDDTGLALLENAAATATGLFAIILMFGPVSGGHFNPVVSLVDAAFGGLSRRDALALIRTLTSRPPRRRTSSTRRRPDPRRSPDTSRGSGSGRSAAGSPSSS